jgi:glyoxylase-like metal-dependent hydrolase (beta-lactamase superfamily II)
MIPPVRCITLPMSLGGVSAGRTVNSFLLPDRPVTLVDAGVPSAQSLQALQAGLAEDGVRLADVELLVISHTHPDHYGGAAAVVRAAAAEGGHIRVAAHPRAAAILDDLPGWWARAREHSLRLLREAGAPDGPAAGGDWPRAARFAGGDGTLDLQVDVVLPDGAVVEGAGGRWQALHTPGHASTQLCLYDPAAQELLSSDHLLPDVSANMVLEPPWPGQTAGHPTLDHLDSLRRLQGLAIRRVWPGHGEPFEDAPAVIAGRIERCEQRLDQVAGAVSGGKTTAWAVAEALYAGTPAAGSQRALFQVVAYLDALVARGRLAVEAGPVWHYFAVPRGPHRPPAEGPRQSDLPAEGTGEA